MQQFKVQHIGIETQDSDQRLDNFLRRVLKGVPKTRIYRLIRKGEVRVNKGRSKPEYRLCAGDVVRIPPVRVGDERAVSPIDTRMRRLVADAVIYEDEQLLVINKPPGLAVHGGSGINHGLIEILRALRPEQKSLELVHRLDRDTSGCVMVAKQRKMLKYLHQQLVQGTIEKTYQALVVGRWSKRLLQVSAPLRKNTLASGERIVRVDLEGKPSRTCYQLLKHYAKYSLVEARPITGRTHQIRVHCKYAGHAIAGDSKYGEDEANKKLKQLGLKRLFLHATQLRIPLPDRGHLLIEAPLTAELQQVLGQLEQ